MENNAKTTGSALEERPERTNDMFDAIGTLEQLFNRVEVLTRKIHGELVEDRLQSISPEMTLAEMLCGSPTRIRDLVGATHSELDKIEATLF